MNIAEHVEFDQLPTECQYLLLIAAMGANLRTGDRRRLSEEAMISVIRGFWNELHLAQSDLRNLSGITDKLCHWYRSSCTTQA